MRELSSESADAVEALDVELIAAVGETGFREGGQLHSGAADFFVGALHRHQHSVGAEWRANSWDGHATHHCCVSCNTRMVCTDIRGVSPLRQLRNVRALDEGRFVFEAMLSGWPDQQSSRGLAERTIGSRELVVRRFEEFAGRYPWEWLPGDLEDFMTQAKSRQRPATPSTIRGYHSIIRLFCDYLTDPRYRWAADCEERFGTAPQQICHEWNTLAHLVDYEGRPQRRALTYDELEQLFAVADRRVETILQHGRKGALAALRDSQIFKTIYAYGLRRAEAVDLDVADLRPNGAAPRFGHFGAVDVRWGKGSHGSGPRRRSVLTLPELGWITEGLAQWVDQAHPRFITDLSGPLWPAERGTRVSLRYIDLRFAHPRRSGVAAGAQRPRSAPHVRHQPHRVGVRREVRAGPGRARLRIDDRHLHVRR